MRSKPYMSKINLQRGKLTVENRKSRERKRICSEVSVNSPGNPWRQSRRRKRKPRWEGFAGNGKHEKGENTQQRIVQLSLDTAAHSSAHAQSTCELTMRKIASTSIEKRGSNSDLTGRKNQLRCEQFINFLGFLLSAKYFKVRVSTLQIQLINAVLFNIDRKH